MKKTNHKFCAVFLLLFVIFLIGIKKTDDFDNSKLKKTSSNIFKWKRILASHQREKEKRCKTLVHFAMKFIQELFVHRQYKYCFEKEIN